jgi:hypothetical protein
VSAVGPGSGTVTVRCGIGGVSAADLRSGTITVRKGIGGAGAIGAGSEGMTRSGVFVTTVLTLRW